MSAVFHMVYAYNDVYRYACEYTCVYTVRAYAPPGLLPDAAYCHVADHHRTVESCVATMLIPEQAASKVSS